MKIKVLLVDDNEPLLNVGKLCLERDAEDFEVTTANSVSEALDLLEFQSFDAIISDYQMPIMDGLDFLASVRSKDEQIPFIIFTGKGREEIAIKALNLGVTHYVIKGGDTKSQYAELIHMVRSSVELNREKKARSEYEERYRIVFENVNDGILMVNRNDRTIQSANTKFCEMLGYTPDEIVKLAVDDIHPKEDLDLVLDAFEKQGRGEIRIAEGLPVLRKDRSVFYADISASAITWEGKDYQLGVFRDVTTRLEEEDSIRAKDELYRLIAENSSDVIFILDMNMNRTYLSPSVERLRGFTYEESLAQSWEEVMTPDSLEKMIMLFGKGFERIRSGEEFREGITTELEMFRKDGTTVWTEVSASAMYNDDGEPIGVVGLTRNISQRKKFTETMRESERQFRQFFSNAPVYCYMVASDGKILSVNKTALDALGYDEDDLIGKDISSLYAPDEKKRVNELVEQWKHSGTIRNEKIDIITKDGIRRTVFLSVSSVCDSSGRLTYSILIQRDISDSDLLVSKRYQTLFETASDAIFLMRDNVFIDCNDKTLEMFGCTRDQILGQPPYKFSPPFQPDGRDSVEKAMEKINMAIEETPQSFYWKHIQYDGTPFDAEVSLNAIEFDGEILVQATVRDITKRVQVENDLKESEERYRALYENLPDGVIGIDTDGLISFCNARVLEMFRYAREEDIVGRHLDEFLHHNYKKAAIAAFDTSLIKGRTAIDGFEGVGIRGDGTEIYFHLSSSLIKVGNEIVGIQSHIRDLSDWKETQELLKNQREELSKLSHTMAHDLRSSIHIIAGLTELYEEDHSEKHLKDIINITNKMDAILSRSVILADAGIIIGNKTFTDLNELVIDVAATSIPDNIQIRHNKLPSLNCDHAKMVQVFQNLMMNAHEHGEASIITIDVEKQQDEYAISISNDGIPIPSEYGDKIFEQGFSSKPHGGLGLSIVKRIIEAHGWKISLDSCKPTTIQICVPSKDIRYDTNS
jgi:PAS domain S-box-containing protein